MTPPLLVDADVAEWLQLEPATLRKMRSRGMIPFLKIGRSVRYDRAALEAWVAEGCPPVTRPAPPAQAPVPKVNKGGRPRGGSRARMRAFLES